MGAHFIKGRRPLSTSDFSGEEDSANPDCDGDGLSTADELFVHGIDPRSPDTDRDGLTDYEELFVYETDPQLGGCVITLPR